MAQLNECWDILTEGSETTVQLTSNEYIVSGERSWSPTSHKSVLCYLAPLGAVSVTPEKTRGKASAPGLPSGPIWGPKCHPWNQDVRVWKKGEGPQVILIIVGNVRHPQACPSLAGTTQMKAFSQVKYPQFNDPGMKWQTSYN